MGAQRDVRGEHAGILMPMAARRRDQRGEAVEQFKRGEGEFGLAAGQGLWEGVADGLALGTNLEPNAILTLASKLGGCAIWSKRLRSTSGD